MESSFWNNYDDSDFMEIELDYSFQTDCNGSARNEDEATTLNGITPITTTVDCFRQQDHGSYEDNHSGKNSETIIDSVQQMNVQENVEEAIGRVLTFDSGQKETSMASDKLTKEPTYSITNVNELADDSSEADLKYKKIFGVSYPPIIQQMYGIGVNFKRNSKVPKTAFVKNDKTKQSLPDWDELKNPFQFEKPIELNVDSIKYYVNYVKLVTQGSSTIYFKLLTNANDSDIKLATLTLKFNNILWYYRAYTEINISQQLEWNWHQNLPDSSSLFLVHPKIILSSIKISK